MKRIELLYFELSVVLSPINSIELFVAFWADNRRKPELLAVFTPLISFVLCVSEGSADDGAIAEDNNFSRGLSVYDEAVVVICVVPVISRFDCTPL